MNSDAMSFRVAYSEGRGVLPPKLSATAYTIVLAANAVEDNNAKLEIARLVRLADICCGYRDYSTLRQLAQTLISTRHGQDAGLYYIALVEGAAGRVEFSRAIMDSLARYASPVFKARALQAIGVSYHRAKCPGEAASLYRAAFQASREIDLLTLFHALHQFSILKSEAGDHKGALEDIIRLRPLIRVLALDLPYFNYTRHNELGYELGQIGRIEEARIHSSIALSFPFAQNYPEWQATRDEIEESAQAINRSRSIAVIHKPEPAPARPKPARPVLPPALACFHLEALYEHGISLSGSLYLSRASEGDFQNERISFSIRRRGPPRYFLSL